LAKGWIVDSFVILVLRNREPSFYSYCRLRQVGFGPAYRGIRAVVLAAGPRDVSN
jgi:hypothetical protein